MSCFSIAPETAGAATKHGITPLRPAANSTVAAEKAPVFRMRVRGKGQVYVHVCKSLKKGREGLICSTASIGRAKKQGSTWTYKPKFYDYPSFWLNTPGTYYWQAHRIACTASGSDCRQEGPVVKFRVR